MVIPNLFFIFVQNLKLNVMLEEKVCHLCKGDGVIEALVSMHGDEKEIVECPNCKGKKVLHIMTDDEERDYWEDYW